MRSSRTQERLRERGNDQIGSSKFTRSGERLNSIANTFGTPSSFSRSNTPQPMPVASTNTASTLSRRASSATFAALHRVGKAQFDRHDAASVPASSKGDRTLVLAMPRNIDTDHQRIAHSGHQLPWLASWITVDELHRSGTRELAAYPDAHEVADSGPSRIGTRSVLASNSWARVTPRPSRCFAALG
jgi:hypothetical protein